MGTPGFYETRPSQAELNSKNWNVHGCIGQHPTPTPTTATQPTEHPKEQSVAEAPPSATLTFVKGLSHPPGVEPKQLEIGGGSQPFYLASIHWSDWGLGPLLGREPSGSTPARPTAQPPNTPRLFGDCSAFPHQRLLRRDTLPQCKPHNEYGGCDIAPKV